MRQHTILFTAVAVVAVTLSGCGRLAHDASKDRPALSTHSPASVDLLIRGEKVAVITNAEPLLSLLRTGWAVDPHACSIPGRMLLRYPEGTNDEIDILPGHRGTNYEFICANGYFAVPRAAFLRCLAAAGVDTNVVPTPPK
jgi:hypothetical protein